MVLRNLLKLKLLNRYLSRFRIITFCVEATIIHQHQIRIYTRYFHIEI